VRAASARELQWGRAASLVLVVVCATACALGRLLDLASWLPRDRNEGWNALLAVRAQQGEALYWDAHALVANNYPPLSFELLGKLGALLAVDELLLGRVVALLALIGSAFAVFAIARALGASRGAAAFAGAFLIAEIAANHASYVAMNDPQWLGHALQLAGLVVLVRRPAARGALVAMVLAMVLGLMTKHTLVVLPVAATFWQVRKRPSAGRLVAAVASCAVLGALALLQLRYGAKLWQGLLLARGYSVHDALRSGSRQALYLAPVVIACWRARARAGDGVNGTAAAAARIAELAWPYFVLALSCGVVLLGGDGVDSNAMFDAVIAASLLAAVVYEAAPRAWVVAGMLLVVCIATPLRVRSELERHAAAPPMLERTREAVAALRAIPGDAACWELALCHRAHKAFVFDAWSVRERQASGALPRDAFAQALAAGRFAAVQVPVGLFGLSREEETALSLRYRRGRVFVGVGEIWVRVGRSAEPPVAFSGRPVDSVGDR
jgi:hypothetical protein